MSGPGLTLGRGLIDTDGGRHRDAVLAAPDGRLELALAEAVRVTPGPVRVPPAVRHRVLAACLERVGDYEEPDAALVAALSRGDADLVALAVREALLGPTLALVVRCANPVCAELCDVDLELADLLPDTREPEPEWFVAEAEGVGRVVLRPVTGADDEALEGVPGSPATRTGALMAAVVRAVDVGGDAVPLPDPDAWWALPAPLRTAALVALGRRPLAPTTALQVGCPACRAVNEVRFDPIVLLGRELQAGAGRLLLETHCLAFHYGWSEDAVLDLPRDRRWTYLALLRAQLTGQPLETAVGHG
ncbi:hypothetical protein [uncultured Cellulomonas sp.]|uniref:hypothetical protein n=1 Tax=uncultured Cellulomonas sp. TaxID=189682 RepID=UPI00262002A6|nr:hypothetical protein [uncultured Cellulomonas sp.]